MAEEKKIISTRALEKELQAIKKVLIEKGVVTDEEIKKCKN